MSMMVVVSGPDGIDDGYDLDEIEYIAPLNGGFMLYFNNMDDQWYSGECTMSFREKQ